MPYHYSSWDRVTPQNLTYWRRIFTQRLHSARRTEPPNPARILAWELAVARVDVLLAAENPAPMDGRQAIALLERAQTLAGFTPYAERAARRAAGLKSHDAPKGTVIDENSGTYVPELRRCFRCKGEHPRDAFLVFPTPAQRALYRIEPDSPRKVPHKLCPACRAHLHTLNQAREERAQQRAARRQRRTTATCSKCQQHLPMSMFRHRKTPNDPWQYRTTCAHCQKNAPQTPNPTPDLGIPPNPTDSSWLDNFIGESDGRRNPARV